MSESKRFSKILLMKMPRLFWISVRVETVNEWPKAAQENFSHEDAVPLFFLDQGKS